LLGKNVWPSQKRVGLTGRRKLMVETTQPGHPNDLTIGCAGCGTPFLFSEGEQAFFRDKELTPPKRCKPCREERRVKKAQEGEKPQ